MLCTFDNSHDHKFGLIDRSILENGSCPLLLFLFCVCNKGISGRCKTLETHWFPPPSVDTVLKLVDFHKLPIWTFLPTSLKQKHRPFWLLAGLVI